MVGRLGKELIPLIKANGKSGQYSQNLLKWVRKYRDKPLFVAFATEGTKVYDPGKTQSGNLYVGFHGLDDGWLHGSQLTAILCDGAKAATAAYQPKMQFQAIPEWWGRYIKGGKCAIDPEHSLYSDHERWAVAEDGKSRRCLWCGDYEQYLHIEMVPETDWRSTPPVSSGFSELPLGKQVHPVLVGRTKNGDIIIQANGSYVRIDAKHKSGFSAAVMLVVSGAAASEAKSEIPGGK